MTKQQQQLTPSIELLSQWCDGWSPSDALLTEHVAMQAALWGWQQRDASVADELQKARDEELEACCEWLNFYAAGADATDLRAARRPQPKSLAEKALEAAQRFYKVLEKLRELMTRDAFNWEDEQGMMYEYGWTDCLKQIDAVCDELEGLLLTKKVAQAGGAS